MGEGALTESVVNISAGPNVTKVVSCACATAIEKKKIHAPILFFEQHLFQIDIKKSASACLVEICFFPSDI